MDVEHRDGQNLDESKSVEIASLLTQSETDLDENGSKDILDRYSIEDVVELKIARFLDQIGTYYPANLYELIISKVEKPLLTQILRRVGGNQVHASKILGINRNTLRKKMKIFGL